jgi:hypothetical protein
VAVKGIEALAAKLQQRVALAVAGDAVAGEHAAHHPFPRIRRAMSCAGAGLRRSSSSNRSAEAFGYSISG